MKKYVIALLCAMVLASAVPALAETLQSGGTRVAPTAAQGTAQNTTPQATPVPDNGSYQYPAYTNGYYGMPMMNWGYYGRGYDGSMMGWGWSPFGWIGSIAEALFWIFIIFAFIAALRWLRHAYPAGHKKALDELKYRFAKGEIGKEEYEEKRKVLKD